MAKTTILTIILSIFYTFANATGDSTQYLTTRDTIFLQVDEYGQKLFAHVLEKNQTLYSLAKFYGIHLEDIYFYNPTFRKKPPSVGTPCIVPIPNKAILRYKTKKYYLKPYIPVYYVVKHGDNLYHIAKHFFNMPLDTIKMRNHLETAAIHTGQQLLVGWMSIEGVKNKTDIPTSPLWKRSNYYRDKFYRQLSSGRKKIMRKGAALWKKNNHQNKKIYALFNHAKPNTIIAVKNPMNGKKIFVKVVGRIPKSSFTTNTEIILSRAAAKMLKARNERFFVEIEYLR